MSALALVLVLAGCSPASGVATPCGAERAACGSAPSRREPGRPEPSAAQLARDRALLAGWAASYPRALAHRKDCSRVLGWVRWPVGTFTCPECPPNAHCEPCELPWVVVLDEPIESAALDRAMIDGSIAVAQIPRHGAPPETGAYLLEGVWVHPLLFDVRGYLPVSDGPPPPDASLGDYCRTR
jgi:hypothetical protein